MIWFSIGNSDCQGQREEFEHRVFRQKWKKTGATRREWKDRAIWNPKFDGGPVYGNSNIFFLGKRSNKPQTSHCLEGNSHFEGRSIYHHEMQRAKIGYQFQMSIWVFPKIGVPQNGLFIVENPIKMDDLEVPLFSETSIFGLWINLRGLIVISGSFESVFLVRTLRMWASKWWRWESLKIEKHTCCPMCYQKTNGQGIFQGCPIMRTPPIPIILLKCSHKNPETSVGMACVPLSDEKTLFWVREIPKLVFILDPIFFLGGGFK